jgi:hypothetical protein
MAQRLRNGIFDPEADRRDFEEYLRFVHLPVARSITGTARVGMLPSI